MFALPAIARLDRWWTARTAFAAVGNGVTLITKAAAMWIPDDELVDKFARWSLAWHYAILQVGVRHAWHRQHFTPAVAAQIGRLI